MGTISKDINLSLNTAQKTSVALCNTTIGNLFDLPISYSFTLKINGTTASGTLGIYIQNEDMTSSFIGTPILTYNIISGTFSSGELTQTFDNNGLTFTKYLGFYWQPTTPSAVDSISVLGQITYN